MKKHPKDTQHATLTVYDADKLTMKQRCALASWLRRQAVFLQAERNELSTKLTCRFMKAGSD